MRAASDDRRATAGLLALLPQILTGLRLLGAPLIWWLVTNFAPGAALVGLALAMISDAVDGALVRRFGVPSRAGAYFDVTADFAVIVAAFGAFAWIGIYPFWLEGLIGLAFVAFLLTSRLTPSIYDPVGRHIGGILYVAAFATLALPDMLAQHTILWAATGALVITIGARAVHTLAALRHR